MWPRTEWCFQFTIVPVLPLFFPFFFRSQAEIASNSGRLTTLQTQMAQVLQDLASTRADLAVCQPRLRLCCGPFLTDFSRISQPCATPPAPCDMQQRILYV